MSKVKKMFEFLRESKQYQHRGYLIQDTGYGWLVRDPKGKIVQEYSTSDQAEKAIDDLLDNHDLNPESNYRDFKAKAIENIQEEFNKVKKSLNLNIEFDPQKVHLWSKFSRDSFIYTVTIHEGVILEIKTNNTGEAYHRVATTDFSKYGKYKSYYESIGYKDFMLAYENYRDGFKLISDTYIENNPSVEFKIMHRKNSNVYKQLSEILGTGSKWYPIDELYDKLKDAEDKGIIG